MNEHDIHTKIQQLIATEHKLGTDTQAGEIDPDIVTVEEQVSVSASAGRS